MMGFEIKFKEQTLLLPSEAIITISGRIGAAEEIHIHAGAYDPISQNSIVWCRSELMLSDEIFINIKEVENTTKPIEVVNFFEGINSTKENLDNNLLKRFLTLKKELEEKKII